MGVQRMKVINFFGGPGAGKSTAAAGLFYEMKKRWVRAELISEFAKELVWAGSSHMLANQHYVFAEQEHRQNRLLGKVDVAITDSPILLSVYYAPADYPISFRQTVFDFFATYDNINIVVRRSHQYAQEGRLQNQDEADLVATSMEEFLLSNGVPYYVIPANDASPRYLLYWLVHEGLLAMPDTARPFQEEDRPPEGWIRPSYQRRMGEDGTPVRPADAVGVRHIQDGIRTS